MKEKKKIEEIEEVVCEPKDDESLKIHKIKKEEIEVTPLPI